MSYPMPTTAELDPIVCPIDVRRGWEQAGLARRVLAAAAGVYVVVAVGCLAVPAAGAGAYAWANDDRYFQAVLILAFSLGPATCYSLARVVRPHRRGLDRVTRHVAAATATSLGVPVLAAGALLSRDDALGVQIILGLPALLLGVLTALWGVVAVLVRWRKAARVSAGGWSRPVGPRPAKS